MHNASHLKKSSRLAVVLATLLLTAGVAAAQPVSESACGGFATGNAGFGPYDYRYHKDKLPIVENAHFTVEVEALLRGKSGYLGQDIAYTLTTFPNHYRALVAATKLAEREGTTKPRYFRYSIDCYFDRAIRFSPDDSYVRMLFAQYLIKSKRRPEALAQVDFAAAKAGDDPFTHFNAGVLYLDLEEWDKALAQAHKAEALGLLRPELRNRLTAAGKWVPPASAGPSQAASDAGSPQEPRQPAPDARP